MQPGLHLRLFKPKVRVRDTMDGSERAVHGPRQGFEVYCMAPERLFFLGPYERLEGAGQGVSLTSMQYVLIEARRGVLGEVRVVRTSARESDEFSAAHWFGYRARGKRARFWMAFGSAAQSTSQ